MRVAVWPVWILLASCSEGGDDSAAPAEVVSQPEVEIVASAATVEFGEVVVGETYTESFTLQNAGTSTVTVTSLDVESPELAIEVPGAPLSPGSAVELTLTWSPTTPGTLHDELLATAEGEGGAFGRASVGVVGVAEAAEVELSASGLDLGYVHLGCSTTKALTLSNVGRLDLVVESLTYEAAEGLELSVGGEPLPPTPWTVEVDESVTIDIGFTPLVEGPVATTLQFVTNDPDRPSASVAVSASGTVTDYGDDRFTVARENVTVLFAANAVMLRSDALLLRYFDTFVDTLQDEGVSYRLALVHGTDGRVQGGLDYIDDSLDADEATDALTTMAENATGDNDYLLQTLAEAIVQNSDWLLDDDAAWAGSKLNLVGLNTDMEQSSGDYVTYVNQYREHKDDDADIAVHGIGGDVPRGCTGTPYSAEPFQPFLDAATMTGGVFLSVCESDWTDHMTTLAEACIGDTGRVFSLSAVPLDWTLRVVVDSVAASSGWTYDEGENAVVFDVESAPGIGSDVGVSYAVASSCD